MNPSKFSLKSVGVTAAVTLALFAWTSNNAQAFQAVATNLDFGSPNVVITTSAGIAMPVGSGVIGIGYFPTLSDAAVTALALNPAGATILDSSFRSFGPASDAIADGIEVHGASGPTGNTEPVNGAGFLLDGLYSFSKAAPIPGTNHADFNLKTMYTMIGDGATFASSGEFLVFKHTGLTFLNDPGLAGDAKIHSSTIPPGEMIIGNFPGPDITTVFGTFPSFELIPLVPEPSRVILSMMGLSAVFLRRRRSMA